MRTIQERMAEIKATQEAGTYTRCPRCGENTMKLGDRLATNEGADRSDIAGGVQYRHLRLYQVANRIQELVPMQVGRPQDVLAQVVGDENGCVAVLLLGRVCGQTDDSVVCYSAAADHVQRFHVLTLI